MGVSGSNWADLPIEILCDMLTELRDIDDFIRFGAVCGSWRSASVESEKTKSFVPWMMLSKPEPPQNFLDVETVMLLNMFGQPEEEEEELSSSENEEQDKDAVLPLRKFFNVSSEKTIELYLPEAEGRRCFGSKFGWILTLGLDLKINLLNPLTRLQISLPPQPTFEKQFPPEYEYDDEGNNWFDDDGGLIGYLRRMYLDKFAWSAHPNHDGGSCVVMVIYSPGRLLAIARPGDTAWTDVKCHTEYFDDVIFFNNTFYVVQHLGDLLVCDITTPVPIATNFMPPAFTQGHSCRFYLVEMSGHLHLVARLFFSRENLVGDYFQITVQFKVYKLDFGPPKKWIELENLGDHALFLGNNSSFATSHPDLRSNCIYFSDDFTTYYKWGRCDMGLFDFGEKKVVGTLYSGDCVHSTFCSPLFFIPNLH